MKQFSIFRHLGPKSLTGILAVVFLGWQVGPLRADLRVPDDDLEAPAGENRPQLLVEVSDEIVVSRLQIPASLLSQYPDEGDAAPPVDGEDSPDDPLGSGASLTKPHTIIAGLALSAAFASALFIGRKSGKSRRVGLLVGLATLLALGSLATVWADIPPGPRRPPVAPDAPIAPLAANVADAGAVEVEVVEGTDQIRLIVSRATLGKVSEKFQPKTRRKPTRRIP